MTNSLSVSSDDVKLGLMILTRFNQSAVMTLTEAGIYSADVLCYDKKKKLIEYEVKVSFTDLKADFKKQEKHKRYLNAINESNENKIDCIPHYFYYVVPETILSEAAAYLAKYPKYGIVSYKNIPFYPTVNWLSSSGFFSVIRRPKLLRTMEVGQQELFRLQKRLSSELIREKIKTKLRG